MRFFDLVEQHDRVRLASHRFRQYAAFTITHISRRRSLERRDCVRFLILAHVYSDKVLLAAVQSIGQRQSTFSLADAAWSNQEKYAHRPSRIGESRAGSSDALRDRFQRMRLANDSLLQTILKSEHGLNLV